MRDGANLRRASPRQLRGLLQLEVRGILLPLGHFQRDAHAAKILARAVVQFACDPPPLVVLRANQACRELAQLLIALFQLGGSLSHLLFEFLERQLLSHSPRLFGLLKLLLRLLAFRNVPIDFQPDRRLALGFVFQRGTAGHVNFSAVSLHVGYFALPIAVLHQLRFTLAQGLRRARLQQRIDVLAHGLRPGPAVELFGAAVPIADRVVRRIQFNDRVIGGIQNVCSMHQGKLSAAIGLPQRGDKTGHEQKFRKLE